MIDTSKPEVLEKEMARIEGLILERSLEVEGLIAQRYALLAEKEDMEMKDVFDCAVESKISAKELMKLIAEAVSKKTQMEGSP